MLADMCLDIEFNIQEIMIMLFQIHKLRRLGSFPIGFEIDPSMNPSLFFTNRAMFIARLQEA